MNATIREGTSAELLVSVVVPVFNEEDCLPALFDRLVKTLDRLGAGYEIVFVDDGSKDRSLEMIRGLAAADPHVGYVSFSRNFGHEAASSAGLKHARGRTIVLIDADLQDPPELIIELVAKWREGFDVVYAQRESRAGETRFTRATSHAFYRIFGKLSTSTAPVDVGDFRLMDRAVVDAFLNMPERKRFVRGMIAWTGFKQAAVLYERQARHAGQTKYDFRKRLALAVDAIASNTVRPLRWIMTAGVALSSLALFAMTALLVAMAIGVGVGGLAWLAAAMTLLAGIQLFSLGVVGEYVGRSHLETQARPLYIVAEEVESHRESVRRRTAA